MLLSPLSLPGAVAVQTLRGNVDPADPYSEVNLCDYTGDSPAHVAQCREQFCRQMGIDLDHLIMPRQTHGTHVMVVDADFMAAPASVRASALQGIDALVTPLAGVCLAINTADCVPIALSDPQAGIIAVAHAGWRGTVAGIVRTTVQAMTLMGATPSRLHAVMGASICPQCFEVGPEVVAQFAAAGFSTISIATRNRLTGKPHIHLQQAVSWALQRAGLLAQNITWNGQCTRCNPSRYFSARRLGPRSGRTLTALLRPRP